MTKKIRMTNEEFNSLNKHMEYLREQEKIAAEEIHKAKENGDLSENAEYDEARKKAGSIKNEIRDTLYKISNCEIIKVDENKNVINIGSEVFIRCRNTGIDALEKGQKFRLVDMDGMIYNTTEEVSRLSASSVVGKKIMGMKLDKGKTRFEKYKDLNNKDRTLEISWEPLV